MINIQDIPHGRARTLASSGAPLYLCVNPVEYHGPHLSLHNDALISAGLIRALHERFQQRGRDWPLLFAGELELGVDTTPGAGSRPVPFRRVREATVTACRALLELGARRVVVMTFHGGPLHALALEAGVTLLRDAGVAVCAPFNALFREALLRGELDLSEAFDELGLDDGLRAELLAALPRDLHAGLLETSLSLALVPESVDEAVLRDLPPCPPVEPDRGLAAAAASARRLRRDPLLAAELELLAWARSWLSLDPFPGYTGSPHLATAAAGAAFVRIFLDRSVETLEAILDGRADSPEPAFRWLEALTLGGRVPLTGLSVSELFRFGRGFEPTGSRPRPWRGSDRRGR
jgi:creatinine amidohydrolase